MNARRFWKIFRLNFKMMYSRWFLALIASYFAVPFVASIWTEDYAFLFLHPGGNSPTAGRWRRLSGSCQV
jgi:hypothetical protein